MQVVIPRLKKILPYFCLLPIGLSAQHEATFNTPQSPVLTGVHGTVSCQEEWQAPPPVLSCPLSDSITYTFEDQYFPLSCQSQGWQGYFAWSNWIHATRQGDGGVDVTGAPNSVLVEGANSASIVLTPGSQAAYELAIPADGFVRFDWSYVGGSSFSNSTFQVLINNETVQGMDSGRYSNTFSSSFLNTGDTLMFIAQAAEQGFKIRLSNFEFLSNALGVVERKWTAMSEGATPISTFHQLITVEKPAIPNIVFPESYDGLEAPTLDNPDEAGPAHTGYPVIDADGDQATTHDQIDLGKEVCSFLATWHDETLFEDGLCIIFRNWTVRDLCGQNRYHATQTLKVTGGCPGWGTPIPYLHQVEDRAIPNFDDATPGKTLTKVMLPSRGRLNFPLTPLYP